MTDEQKRFNALPEAELDEGARQALLNYGFPGNVRELQNVIQRAMVLCPDGILRVQDVPGESADSTRSPERSTAQFVADAAGCARRSIGTPTRPSPR